MRLISRDELLAMPAATHHTKQWSGVLDPKSPPQAAIARVLDLAKGGKPHEPHYSAFKWLPPPRLLLDVGANCGQSVVSFRTIGLTCPIKSFEPNTLPFEIGREVAKASGDSEFFNFGLSDKSERLAIFTPVIDGLLITPLTSLYYENFEPGGSMHQFLTTDIAKGVEVAIYRQDIELRRGDELQLRPDVIKIDVEGAELRALTGFSETISRFRPMLMIEKSDALRVAQHLADFGYSPYSYNADVERPLMFRKLPVSATTGDAVFPVNVLYLHKDGPLP